MDKLERKYIDTIFAHHRLGTIKSVKQIKGGMVNHVYDVNGKYVVKLDMLGRGFTKENYVLRSFSRLPLPKVVAYDASMKIVPREYIVQYKLPGKNLAFVWPDLSLRHQELVFKQIIGTLKQFHAKKFRTYGGILPGEKKYKTWKSCFADYFVTALQKGKESGWLSSAEINDIKSYFLKNQSVLALKVPAVLCHSDLVFSNVLVEGTRVRALLDFDLSLAAPIDWEFSIPLTFYKQPSFFVVKSLRARYQKPLADCPIWLEKYYPELFKIPYFKERIALYAVAGDLWMLWLCDAFKHNTKTRKTIKERLLKTIRG